MSSLIYRLLHPTPARVLELAADGVRLKKLVDEYGEKVANVASEHRHADALRMKHLRLLESAAHGAYLALQSDYAPDRERAAEVLRNALDEVRE